MCSHDQKSLTRKGFVLWTKVQHPTAKARKQKKIRRRKYIYENTANIEEKKK